MQMCVIVKTRCFYDLPIKNQKIQYTILNISTKANSLQHLTRFHGGFFELEIPESFARAFLLKTLFLDLNFLQALYSAPLKNEIKNLLEKDASHRKNYLTVDIE